MVARLRELHPLLQLNANGGVAAAAASSASASSSLSASPSPSDLVHGGVPAPLSVRVDMDTLIKVLLEIDPLLEEHHIRTLFKVGLLPTVSALLGFVRMTRLY